VRQRTIGLLLFLLLLLALALASGNEVISTLWLIAGSLLLFSKVLLFARLPIAESVNQKQTSHPDLHLSG
jgi:hypothetical protein